MFVLDVITDPTLLAGSQGIVDSLEEWIKPVLLLMVGIAGLTFLFTRQMSQFLQYMLIAIGVLMLFLVPELIETIGKAIGTGAKGKVAGG